jgi:5-oxoprolinase (ATP-hydrolysing)
MTQQWEFWIDVGGTFTDCIARAPDGSLVTNKVLSSGVTKGRIARISGTTIEGDQVGESDGFWNGYEIRFLGELGQTISSCSVIESRGKSLVLAAEPEPSVTAGTRFELDGHEEAPILAIRKTLNLQLADSIDNVTVKLGTTRGTNALLTRTGARTAFVTTQGFKDVLLIGNQDRPRLFDLAIKKPEPLFEQVVEINERIDTNGQVLLAPNEQEIRNSLTTLKATGVQSLAICLLHAFANGDHERVVERIAREVGFEEISTSSRLSPLIKIVSRGDTTVMDAYLNPILRDYVQRLRASLGACELKMMTSAGGLVNADSFVGKDSILSGPAGGVIGFSRVAERAGHPRSIGFDMGGTSTDVSRFDGEYEMEFETQKAGVRIVSPMLAIETVAAGGGSVCGFDGVKLFVGPQSAGADPGPACYGRGGPLTVTDINLHLGRILPQHFPFSLDAAVVDAQLKRLCDEIAASPLGKLYSPIQLADGFRQIANANMVRAIRKISVAKGYDPADYVLVTFGGAGAQHACAMARSLGIDRVLIHPFAGILSAYGIGLADVKRFAERSVLKELNQDTTVQLSGLFAELETQALAEVKAERIPDDRIKRPIRSLELRYRGAESAINITADPCDDSESFDFRQAFEKQHQRLFGYLHSNRELEVVAARVEAIGEMDEPLDEPAELVTRSPEPSESCQAWFDGIQLETAVFNRIDMQAGDQIVGPAIICEPTSTVVVEPDCLARIESRGEILIEVGGSDGLGHKDAATQHQTADPVMLEIFNNLFASIADQMGVTLQKTSFSTNVKERLDFSCAIFTPTGDLVVNAPHIPVHLGAMSETVKWLLADQPNLVPGDVFVTNDPFRGGSHLPDVTVITPVHLDDRLIFLTASRAHHAEIGGIVPGSMPPFSKRLSEEGVLIRNFQLVQGGKSYEDELRQLLSSGEFPSRSVDDNIADVSAQVAANNSGVRQLNDLVSRYSLEFVHAYMHHIQRAASEKMRRALKAIPDGIYSREDALDDGSPIKATIKITGDHAAVDFSGTGPVLDSNLNANKAIVTAAVLYVFRCLIDEDIPLNSGVLDPVSIHLPECLLNPPCHDDPADCVAIVGGNVETSQRVVDVLLGALEMAAASQGTMNNLTFGDDSFGYYETICGGSGATRDSAGADAVHTHMTNTRLTDVEVIERRYPVRLHEFSIRRNSGGAGAHRGGDGVIRRIEFLRPLHVSILSERRAELAPFGLAGGEPGKIGRNSIQRAAQDSIEELSGKVQLEVNAGDVLTIETPGGGGYG